MICSPVHIDDIGVVRKGIIQMVLEFFQTVDVIYFAEF